MCKRFIGETLMNDKGGGKIRSDRCEKRVGRKEDGGGELHCSEVLRWSFQANSEPLRKGYPLEVYCVGRNGPLRHPCIQVKHHGRSKGVAAAAFINHAPTAGSLEECPPGLQLCISREEFFSRGLSFIHPLSLKKKETWCWRKSSQYGVIKAGPKGPSRASLLGPAVTVSHFHLFLDIHWALLPGIYNQSSSRLQGKALKSYRPAFHPYCSHLAIA